MSMNIQTTPKPDPRSRVLILGASFGGLEVLYQLRRRARPAELEVVLVDRAPAIPYVPLAHEAILHPEGTDGPVPAVRLAEVASHLGAELVLGEIERFEPARRRATVRGPEGYVFIEADAVVVALGSRLGPPAAFPGREHVLSHKAAADLARCRERLAQARAGGHAHLTVVGGGLTGVELAAELARDGAATVELVAGDDGVLPELPPFVGRAATASLGQQGVVVTNARASSVREGEVLVEDGRSIETDLCFWGGGVQPAPVLERLGLATNQGGFLRADLGLRCRWGDEVAPGVFAVGDAAVLERSTSEGFQRVPQMHGRVLEPFWQAPTAAQNVLQVCRGFREGQVEPKQYRPRASFPHGISVGRSALVYSFGQVRDLGAFAAWGRRQLGRWWARRYVS